METDELSDALRAATTDGEKLRAIRQRAGYTLGELARAADIDKGYLSRVENGHVPPPVGESWTRYENALLAPLAGPDHESARGALTGITNMGTLSTAAVNQVLRDYPPLATLILNTARAGLTDEERRALGALVLMQSKRSHETTPHAIATHGRPILRERRSSAKAKEHDEPL